MKQATLILIALVATVTGCASTPTTITNKQESLDYTVNMTFDTAFQNIQIGAKRCFEAREGMTVYIGMVDTQTTRISAKVGGGGTVAVLDITEINDQQTQIRGTWHASVGSIWYRYIVASQNWVKGLYHKCQATPDQI